jgi:hypothetical protein
MLPVNKITDEIQMSVDKKNSAFGIQSMDVSADGVKALLLGIYEDPDFPEVFIYNGTTKKARKIKDEGSFMDVPVGKSVLVRE